MDKLYGLIQKTPVGQRLAVVGLLLGMIVAGYYFMVYDGHAKELDKLAKQLGVLEEELQEKIMIANNKSKFQKKVYDLQQKLEEKKKNLPDDANMDQLLKTLNEFSEKSDIRIVKFTPQPEVPKNFYAEIPVRMEIEGNYHEIANFFDKVSKETRIINISDIKMEKPELRNGKIVLKAYCLAKTFRSIPVEKQSQTAAAGTAAVRR